jgi:hypothetical protein
MENAEDEGEEEEEEQWLVVETAEADGKLLSTILMQRDSGECKRRRRKRRGREQWLVR